MSAGNSESTPQPQKPSPATQEKIREFCYELALVLRRITGKVIDNDPVIQEQADETPGNAGAEKKAGA